MSFPVFAQDDGDRLCQDVIAILEHIRRTARSAPEADAVSPLYDLEYERWVEQPRRAGADPVERSLMIEAVAKAHGINPTSLSRLAWVVERIREEAS